MKKSACELVMFTPGEWSAPRPVPSSGHTVNAGAGGGAGVMAGLGDARDEAERARTENGQLDAFLGANGRHVANKIIGV